jgi:putative tryptophan/tyrosine transport system substrate-binding protein
MRIPVETQPASQIPSHGVAGKWLELLKEVAPDITRALVLGDPDTVSMSGQMPAIEAATSTLSVQLVAAKVHGTPDIEHAIGSFANPLGGLVVLPSNASVTNRQAIIAAAARHSLPGVYPYHVFAADGGLIAYGPDVNERWIQAASYVDRILRGERPGDLSIQEPTKLQLVINLKTAKALRLTVPPALLARADEVIE